MVALYLLHVVALCKRLACGGKFMYGIMAALLLHWRTAGVFYYVDNYTQMTDQPTLAGS